jgi:hypothetical protein
MLSRLLREPVLIVLAIGLVVIAAAVDVWDDVTGKGRE